MNKEEIQSKIQDLLDTGQSENTYIAVFLKVNELGLTLKEALAELEPIEYERNYAHEDDFYCSIRISNVWIEYEHLDSYIPYMGTEASTSRVLSFTNNGAQESIEGQSKFLPTGDGDTIEDVKRIIKKDYLSLIPIIIRLLEKA